MKDKITGYDFSEDTALPRQRAVVEYCKGCRPGQHPKSCDNESCALWPYRTNRDRSGIDRQGGRINAIKSECRDCCNGSSRERKMCHITGCPLWPYRLGSASKSGGVRHSMPGRGSHSKKAAATLENTEDWK